MMGNKILVFCYLSGYITSYKINMNKMWDSCNNNEIDDSVKIVMKKIKNIYKTFIAKFL